MGFKFNIFTGTLDIAGDSTQFLSKVADDTTVGKVTINPTGATSLISRKDIYLNADQKLYFDGT